MYHFPKRAHFPQPGYGCNHFLDIIAAVDTPIKATRCEHESPMGCRMTGEQCLTHDLWDELGAVIELFLTRVTLEDVCEKRIVGM